MKEAREKLSYEAQENSSPTTHNSPTDECQLDIVFPDCFRVLKNLNF